jgi:DNA-binding protein YbaB
MSMFSKLKQIKDLRDQAKQIQNVLKDVHAEGTGAHGKVRVTLNGNLEVTAVTLEDEILKERHHAETAVKDALNDAIKKAQKLMAEEMRRSGNLNLPGLS